MKNLLRIFVVLLFAVWAGLALAQSPSEDLKDANTFFSIWETEAAQVEDALKGPSIDDAEATGLRSIIEPQRAKARSLSDAAKKELVPLQEQITALGPAPEEGKSEDASVAAKRIDLQRKVDNLQAIVSKAELAYTRSDRLLEEITATQRRRFTQRLLERGPTPLNPSSWITAGQTLLGTLTTTTTEIFKLGGRDENQDQEGHSKIRVIAGLVITLLLVLVLRYFVLRRLAANLGVTSRKPSEAEIASSYELSSSQQASDSTAPDPAVSPTSPEAPFLSHVSRLFTIIGLAVMRLILPIIVLLAIRYTLIEFQILGPVGKTLLDGFTRGFVVFFIGLALVRAFFAPKEPQLRLSTLNDQDAATATRQATLIIIALALDRIIISSGEVLNWPIETLTVLNFTILVLGSVPLWQLCKLSIRNAKAVALADPSHDDSTDDSALWFTNNLTAVISRAGLGVAIISPLLAMLGYFAFSRYLFYNALMTAGLIAVLLILYSLVKEFSTMLASAEREYKQKINEPTKEDPKRTSLLAVFFGFLLTLAALPILALIWGATIGDLKDVSFALTNGFKIGDVVFRPADLLIGAFVFGIGMVLSRSIQTIVKRTVMPNTRLDTGAQSSIISGIGYLGFFISVLMASNVAGLDLSNLAFLGAALGVGIGFGLQNIVNNFVSGIILLVERPIKVGDWIEVGGVHGTVNKIKVRATEIQTFDKASYIVPNSDLISGAVTNMTHDDLYGRVIVPVQVAYGTDTHLVEKILLEIARAHPMTLRHPPPTVLFKAFGADALDFELRAFLRDVNWISFTLSDLNFEIDRRFRAEGIEIPYAQRDLHIKSVEPLIQAIKPTEADFSPNQQPRTPDPANNS